MRSSVLARALTGALLLSCGLLTATSACAQVRPPAAEPALGFGPYRLGGSLAQIPAEALRCGPARQTPTRTVCVGSWQTASPAKVLLGGVWISELTLLFSDNRLVRIDVLLDSRRFDEILVRLRGEFGAADENREVLSGGHGVRIAGRREVWRKADGILIAREATNVPHYSALRFYANGWAPALPPPARPKP